jgi:hypothetical protein
MERPGRPTGFEHYWKLPQGFLTGTSLPGEMRACRVVQVPGAGESLRRMELGGTPIFCPTGWPSAPSGLRPLLDLRDPTSGEVLASVGPTRDGALYCPFVIQSVTEAFQLEAYLESEGDSAWLARARRVYYRLRPLLPRGVQIRLRQSIAPLQGSRTFPAWPLDVSLDRFHHLVLKLIMQVSDVARLPFVWFWPDGHANCVVLTHDVDTQVGHDSLWPVVELERKYGFRSLWNFVPKRYRVDRKVLSTLQADGFEIGVHGLYHDGRLFDSLKTFQSRALQINQYVREWGCEGFRAPSLVRNIEWIAADLQVKYDTSCPTSEVYAPQPGGCCTVFPFMVGQLVELPLTMPQDHALYVIMKGQSEDAWTDIASEIMDWHGLVQIVVHPDYTLHPQDLARYERFLQWLTAQRRDTWHALPGQVAAWWGSRVQQKLVHEDGSWRVRGPGSQRARVAQVSVEGVGLAFQIQPPG